MARSASWHAMHVLVEVVLAVDLKCGFKTTIITITRLFVAMKDVSSRDSLVRSLVLKLLALLGPVKSALWVY